MTPNCPKCGNHVILHTLLTDQPMFGAECSKCDWELPWHHRKDPHDQKLTQEEIDQNGNQPS